MYITMPPLLAINYIHRQKEASENTAISELQKAEDASFVSIKGNTRDKTGICGSNI